MARSLDELRAGPRDRDAFLVYADWLQAQGHPRGELIALMDALEHTRDGGEHLELRRQVVRHLRAHPKLWPPAPAEPELPDGGALDARDLPRHAWADWRRGFVRRVDLLFDGTLTISESSELIAKLVAHPSAALLEHLVIYVDMRGEPLDETEAARAIALSGLSPTGILGEPRPGSPADFRLDLWTEREPGRGQLESLRTKLADLRPRWSSSRGGPFVFPPSDRPAASLARELREEFEGRGALAWFDERAHIEISEPTDRPYSGDWWTAVRGLAEDARSAILGAALLERGVAALLAGLAPWLRVHHDGPEFGAATALDPLEPERVELPALTRRLADRSSSSRLVGAVEDFAGADPSLRWAWVPVVDGRGLRAVVVGISARQALALTLP